MSIHKSSRALLASTSALALAFAATVLVSGPAAAATITVSDESELNAAILDANVNPDADTITLESNITLTGDLLYITESLSVIGTGFIIDGAEFKAFTVESTTPNISTTFTNLTVENAMWGVNTEDSNVTITGSAFDDATVIIDGNGITIDVAQSSFDNASGFGDRGLALYLYADSVAAITNTSADLNNLDGIWIDSDSSTVTITDSSADANDDDGFGLRSRESSITLSKTSANDNDDLGFDSDVGKDADVEISASMAARNLGGGLEVDVYGPSSVVTINDSVFADHKDDYGVEIVAVEGVTVSLERVTVTGNGDGGVLIEDDSYDDDVNNAVTISDSTIADNDGTGIDINSVTSSDVFVRGTTISGNSHTSNGAIEGDMGNDSSLSIVNSTISGNRQVSEGAISASADAEGAITISHSTIADNITTTAGKPGGILIEAANYSVNHSIIAGNTADGVPSDLRLYTSSPPTGSINYSLIQASTGSALSAVDAGTGNMKNISAQLGALADNGGQTLTHLPLNNSPAINVGNPAITGAPATDQRGQTRIVGIIDLGSVETKQALPAATGSVEAKQALLAATGSNPTIALAGGAILLLLGVVLVMTLRYRLSC